MRPNQRPEKPCNKRHSHAGGGLGALIRDPAVNERRDREAGERAEHHFAQDVFAQDVAGSALGELSGSSLAVLPSFVATWSEWQALHPETVVLVGDSDGSLDSDRYARDSFDGYERVVDSGRFAFSVTGAVRDDRLLAAEVVVVIGAGGTEKAFPASVLDAGANVEVGGGARARGSNARWRACGRVRPQARRARAQLRHGRLRARRS